MPASKKRKTGKASVATAEVDASPPARRKSTSPEPQADMTPTPVEALEPNAAAEQSNEEKLSAAAGPATTEAAEASASSGPGAVAPSTTTTTTTSAADRLARFKALKARAQASADENHKQAALEASRQVQDPTQLSSLQRKHDAAAFRLLRAEADEAGEDFERKRAWDWTVDETEAWDRRTRKKAGRRDGNTFHDYRSESNKVYKRQLAAQKLGQDREAYERERAAAIDKAAERGGLEIVETEDGELIAVDRDGSFYSTSDSTTFADNRPDRAAIDRLVDDLKRAEEQRLKKRRERMAKNGDDGDVTYINEKNKQFNQKLTRFYDKYTQDLRDSFERGTNI